MISPIVRFHEPFGMSFPVFSDEGYLLASIESDIFLVNLRSTTLKVLSSEKQPILSLDYDWKEQKVYWINMDAEAVMWTTLDQNSRGTLIQGAVQHLKSA